MVFIKSLIEGGQLKKLNFLEGCWNDLKALTLNRSMPIWKLALEIYKESYLWIGKDLNKHLDKLESK
jgi:hypothetical protein